ncbi:XRE family transcriptional regulator [Enterococcus gilvus]|uniref:XRE family transcriptional regulator n=1 Tax=Enterococcus gilvus TaxID=160453 RepID=UPI001C8B763D|nr:XRE family transcriptional regulator [Enterococcus gilvus]MBX8939253.1 helix-turn-helix transcriptional regulator [Enterococcus gilvus]
MNEIIKMKRLEKNMSLEEVGKLVGVGKSTVRKWENGMIENMGRDKIVALSKALDISPLDILGMSEKDLPKSSIETIYNQLEKPRQTKVYNFAEQQLEEQNSNVVQFPVQNNHEEVQAYLSAGTGILNYYEADKDIVEVPADAPEHDWIFKIVGDSMKPLFDTGDIVYVDEFKQGVDTIQNGRIYVVEVDGEAYIKKVYVYEETKTLRLVSLNKDYTDLLFKFENSDINFIGRVII